MKHFGVFDCTGSLCNCGWKYDASAWGEAIAEEEAGRALNAHIRWETSPRGPIFEGTPASPDGWTGD